MSSFDQPSREQLEAFRAGDPVAIDEVITLVLPQVTRWAANRYDDIPKQETASVVNQVFAEISFHPERYDPDKARITTYAINLLKLRMNDKRQTEYDLVRFEGFSLDDHENYGDGTYNDLEQEIDIIDLFETVSDQLSDVEREFLMLMRAGEKNMEVFVDILSKHADVRDPEREVNTIKERIKRRLNATARKMGLDQPND